jgi:hypothetical protein
MAPEAGRLRSGVERFDDEAEHLEVAEPRQVPYEPAGDA